MFRWLVDLSVIELLEEKKQRKSDFVVTENYHIRLRAATAKILIKRISLNFNRTAKYKSKNHTYQNILLDTVQQLANFILVKKSLQFHIPAIKIQRNGSAGLTKNLNNVAGRKKVA